VSKSTQVFYDNLADSYRYIFPDWVGSVARQGKTIDQFLEVLGFSPAHHSLYDCTCGIGTQTFGLALQGWNVHGTDLSAKSIDLAREYASEFDTIFTPTFDVRDLLQPAENPIQYDIVLSLDNAVPHFMTDEDLITGLTTMRDHLADNGLLMISIRDYDVLIENPPKSTLPSVFESDEGKRMIFQVWDWAEDLSYYDLNMYVVHHYGDDITTQCFPAQYRALRRETLTSALDSIGLKDIQWFMPDESTYYQPIVTARKP